MKKLVLIATIVTTFSISACSTKAVPATPTPAATTTVMPAQPVDTTPGYTLTDVAKHNTASDCRSIIGGKVYNLSSYFGNHPGGDETLQIICGKDGTAAFEKKHTGSETAKAALQALMIGGLK